LNFESKTLRSTGKRLKANKKFKKVIYKREKDTKPTNNMKSGKLKKKQRKAQTHKLKHSP
jgi:hypothetical protein